MLLCCVKTIKDEFIAFQQGLGNLYNKEEVNATTLLIISEILNLSKANIKAFPETEITTEQAEQLESILAQLRTGKPLQYILGHTEFYGLKFLVNPNVLIPRPETEELVDWAIQSMVNNEWSIGKDQLATNIGQYQMMDIGTGSGCIAISLKKNLPDAQVWAIDISPGALQTAKENARLNEVDVNFIQADILNPINNSLLTTHSLQLIVSNPPYVTPKDKEQMHINVINFEPHAALFVPEDDPLLFYKAIADFAVNNLVNNGLLFLEINESYGPETVQLLANKSFKNIELKKDMSDRYRMIKAVFSNGL
ncbi:MAG: prmC [Mucilaginibacter sp.]|nr:prmC [Mucilaginibacter sp.]